jgi:hypothetical protein
MLLRALGSLTLLLGRPIVPVAELEPSGSYRDGGGNPVGYAKAVDRLKARGEAYVAPIICASAASMLLDAPNVIWRPKASIGVHSATVFGFTGGMADAYNELIASYYPRRFGEWFLEEGPGKTYSEKLEWFSPQDLIENFGARLNVRSQREA